MYGWENESKPLFWKNLAKPPNFVGKKKSNTLSQSWKIEQNGSNVVENNEIMLPMKFRIFVLVQLNTDRSCI